VAEGAWHLRKAKSLVKLLALAPGHALHREQIMNLLWPELGNRAASNNLRGSLHGARRALAAETIVAFQYLVSKEERVAPCPEVELWVDVEAFEEAANAARRSRDPGGTGALRWGTLTQGPLGGVGGRPPRGAAEKENTVLSIGEAAPKLKRGKVAAGSVFIASCPGAIVPSSTRRTRSRWPTCPPAPSPFSLRM
jgi:hypothetical protein